MSQRDKTKHPDYVPAWKSPWVWGIGLGITTMLGANITMIMIGTNSHPGLVIGEYYDKGKYYFENENKRKADLERLGWVMEIQKPAKAVANTAQQYAVQVKGKDGYPLPHAKATLELFRPSDSKQDFSVPLKDLGNGLYGADVVLRQPGKWDLIVTVSKGEDKLDLAERISVEK